MALGDVGAHLVAVQIGPVGPVGPIVHALLLQPTQGLLQVAPVAEHRPGGEAALVPQMVEEAFQPPGSGGFGIVVWVVSIGTRS